MDALTNSAMHQGGSGSYSRVVARTVSTDAAVLLSHLLLIAAGSGRATVRYAGTEHHTGVTPRRQRYAYDRLERLGLVEQTHERPDGHLTFNVYPARVIAYESKELRCRVPDDLSDRFSMDTLGWSDS